MFGLVSSSRNFRLVSNAPLSFQHKANDCVEGLEELRLKMCSVGCAAVCNMLRAVRRGESSGLGAEEPRDLCVSAALRLIFMWQVPVRHDDTANILKSKVQELEGKALIGAVRLFDELDGRLPV